MLLCRGAENRDIVGKSSPLGGDSHPNLEIMKSIFFVISLFIIFFLLVAFGWAQQAPELYFGVSCLVAIGLLSLFKGTLFKYTDLDRRLLALSLTLGILYAICKLYFNIYIFEIDLDIDDLGPSTFNLLEKIIFLGLFMPLLEEFFFRGILFDDLKKWLGVNSAVVGSSVLFLLVHIHKFESGMILKSLLLMLPGVIIYTYLRLKTNNFVNSFIVHATHNSLVVFTLEIIS